MNFHNVSSLPVSTLPWNMQLAIISIIPGETKSSQYSKQFQEHKMKGKLSFSFLNW